MPGIGASVKTAKESVENLKNSAGTHELEKLASLATKEKRTDRAIETKDALTKSFVEKKELGAETLKKEKPKSLLRRGLKWAIGGGFGLILGKKFFGEKKENVEIAAEKTTEIVEESTEIWTDEERLKNLNDSIESGKKTKSEIESLQKKVNEKYNFVPEKEEKDWRKYLGEKEKKYADYGHVDAWSDAWKKTEFEYDHETGEKKERGLFFRLFAFFPALIGSYKSWKTFEKMKNSGMLDTVKSLDSKKGEVEAKIEEVETKIDEGIESKREGFSAVFEENPYALNLSKNYFLKLGNLLKSADKISPEAQKLQIENIKNTVQKNIQTGVKKFGPGFGKMKNYEKFLPGMSVKMRGGLVFVEIIGKSLGEALRSGVKNGGWTTAWDVFKNEATDAENWKDACPIWGTVRSFKKLGVDDGQSRWSKWLESGLSLGMDVATVVGIAGSFGTATPAILAARAAGGAAVKSGIRKLTFREMVKKSAGAGEKFAAKNLTKESRKVAGRQIMRTAGGRLHFKLQILLTTISTFFGEDVDNVVREVKTELPNKMLSREQKRFLELTNRTEFSEKSAVETAPEIVENAEIAENENSVLPTENFTETEKAAISEEDKKHKTEIKISRKKPTSTEILETIVEEEPPTISIENVKEAAIELVKKEAA
ncbi:hypothetical protein HN954_03435 [bacterium]|jgi:hypothetical protein|nr:hypothetical protein [bacterium]MBT6832230.1 hypothetical protein [bacterium]MBT6996455.1 hypothetical protein [bacterium]MBT7772298.1 hypothetical protein [bacterium]